MPTLPSFDVPDADVAVIALEDGKGRQFTLMPRRVPVGKGKGFRNRGSLCIVSFDTSSNT